MVHDLVSVWMKGKKESRDLIPPTLIVTFLYKLVSSTPLKSSFNDPVLLRFLLEFIKVEWLACCRLRMIKLTKL